MHLVMADDQGDNNTVMREYRKGNWTVDETMVLIEAKKMDDERRLMKKISGDHSERRGDSKPAELRWKWVEDYCWRKGCLRSQNQCNDKWDNLLRDFKKVRDYQRRIMDENNGGSYWEMEKNERKEKNLPSNMLRQIYERLEEVAENKEGGGGQSLVAAAGGVGSGSPIIPKITFVLQSSLPPLLEHQLSDPIPASIPLLIPAPPPPLLPPATAVPAPVEQPPSLSYAQPLLTLYADRSEYSDSPAKRRRRAGNREGTGGGGGGNTASNSNDQLGTAISRSASIIAEAIHASDEREEKRHKDLVSLHERRLKIEESRMEINKRAIDGLVDAINKLASCILALVSSYKNQSSCPK